MRKEEGQKQDYSVLGKNSKEDRDLGELNLAENTSEEDEIAVVVGRECNFQKQNQHIENTCRFQQFQGNREGNKTTHQNTAREGLHYSDTAHTHSVHIAGHRDMKSNHQKRNCRNLHSNLDDNNHCCL